MKLSPSISLCINRFFFGFVYVCVCVFLFFVSPLKRISNYKTRWFFPRFTTLTVSSILFFFHLFSFDRIQLHLYVYVFSIVFSVCGSSYSMFFTLFHTHTHTQSLFLYDWYFFFRSALLQQSSEPFLIALS